MSFRGQHFISFRGLTRADILFLFESINIIPDISNKNAENLKKTACLLFLEPSTRTQLSFELACKDIGISTSLFIPENSSMKKGETLLDTLLNLEAMGFDAFIVRHGDPEESLADLSTKVKKPIINAGEGVSGHPTQALLDLYTIYENKNSFEKEKILFVGDIKHSRVVSSNVELLNLMGVEYAFCGPAHLIPEKSKTKYFDSLQEGMDWATTVMALRYQNERHQNANTMRDEFVQKYSVTSERLRNWKKDGLVLHPGPFNREIEIASDILTDPRVLIFKQVENGRKIRRRLLYEILGGC